MSLFPAPVGVDPKDAKLAWELVMNIAPLGDIMRRHELSFDDYEAKKRDPVFKGMLDEFRRNWNSEMSVNQRVALKAALLAEDSLLDVYQIVKDVDASPGQKLEAFGALAKAGEIGVVRKDSAGAGAAQVQININVPGKEPVTVSAQAIVHEELASG